jgi:dTDP-4-dehydrorhamnose reductase
MRLLITGWQGQLARALVEAAAARPEITALSLGRPALDLCARPSILRSLTEHTPDIVINTAAYTAVDKAEAEPDAAFRLNRDGAGMLAEAAASQGVPIIHLSTDYVFDGAKSTPYVETDATSPRNVYGASKLAGEAAVAAVNPQHIILRTAWVHSPFGQNFVKTMLRIAATKPRLGVVADQHGNPTFAPHLATAILDLAIKIYALKNKEISWGIYHAAGSGETSWHGLAQAVFVRSKALGGPAAEADPISATAYPTPAARPANSRLDCGKLERQFAVRLPDWQVGVDACVARLLQPSA